MDIVKITDTIRAMGKNPEIKISVMANGFEVTWYQMNLKGRKSSVRRPQYQVLAVGDLTPAPRQGTTKPQPKEADWNKVWQRINKPS